MSSGPTSSDCYCEFYNNNKRLGGPHLKMRPTCKTIVVNTESPDQLADDGSRVLALWVLYTLTLRKGSGALIPGEKGRKGEQGRGDRGREWERSQWNTVYAMWASGNVWLLVVITVMKQGTGWYAFASTAQCGPREPRQMSPEIQEIEWIMCDWEGEGRCGGVFWVEEQRAREG